ncbi:natural resistance-associated macrophage protein [Teratosphaeria nubilosa]|uniref:Natural resistance-associated macrophage protein n=1 Tax=Teratosphaeria nubilosa TaxID=161662 RepID=A0A6G1LCW2_9PEZI|nr:natural resistance-associated macrophage protein [Teratosphaeria nubilosa]
MNCPSKTDPEVPLHWNQNPDALASDTTTCSDLSRIASARLRSDHRIDDQKAPHVELHALPHDPDGDAASGVRRAGSLGKGSGAGAASRTTGSTGSRRSGRGQGRVSVEYGGSPDEMLGVEHANHPRDSEGDDSEEGHAWYKRWSKQTARVLVNYAKFIGPGFMISVAYIDPGNYATDVSAGATYRFKLLFVVLLSNLFAIFLQSLCIKLGSVTGLNLAEMCRLHFPKRLNYILYILAESAIIATDIAEVIGTAISLNLLLHIPLVAGCAISILDVLFILLFYHPNGTNMRALRVFETFVMLLVLGVVICFCFQLSLIKGVAVREVFKGYLPSSTLVQGEGLYQACGILGATVMPHSLYLGSGITQARLKDFDLRHNSAQNSAVTPSRISVATSQGDVDEDLDLHTKYRPSISAIRSCLSYSIVELAISLFTFALFVNSAILITAGASLSGVADAADADLFSIHDLLERTLAPAAGTIFALALLLSGTSAGIVCTIAGQMVSEGQLRIAIKPWQRRLITRSISITPSIIIAGAVGKDGLSTALEASQVALSIILPFVSAPLIYFTCRNKYMTVVSNNHGDQNAAPANRGRSYEVRVWSMSAETYKMKNGWITMGFAAAIWGIIVVMNVALLVLLGLGKE